MRYGKLYRDGNGAKNAAYRVKADPGSGLFAEQVKERFACHADNYKVESSTMQFLTL